MTKGKWYTRALSVTIALSFVLGGLVTAAPVAADNPTNHSLEVTITKPLVDGDPLCQDHAFAVTAEIKNVGDSKLEDVVVAALLVGDGKLVNGEQSAKTVKEILPGATQEVNWTAICTGEGDLTITVTTPHGEDTITVKQLDKEKLTVEIEELPYKIGPCNEFEVRAIVRNAGCGPIDTVTANIVIDGSENAILVSPLPGEQSLGTLEPGDYDWVTWTLKCTDLDHPGFTDWPPDSYVLTEITVNVTGMGVKTGTDVSDYDVVQVEQSAILVEIVTPADEQNVQVCTEFDIRARVTNLTNCTITGVQITVVDVDGAGLINISTTPPHMQSIGTLGPNETRYVPLDWHAKCTGAGETKIQVWARGTTAAPCLCLGANRTVGNQHTITILQENPPELDVVIDAPPCAAKGELFEVTATISNTAEAPCVTIIGVGADLDVIGNAVIVDGPDFGPTWDGTIQCEGNVTATWLLECTGKGPVELEVTASGFSKKTGLPVPEATDAATVEQMCLTVEIITPEDGSKYAESQTFCVTAVVHNCGDDNLPGKCKGNVTATIRFPDGGVELVAGETETKELGTVYPCQPVEVSWTVHCDGPGDHVIEVFATSPFCDNCQPLETVPATITVHQEEAAKIKAKIVSPQDDVSYEYDEENFIKIDAGTVLATGQEFAVSAKIWNDNDGGADAFDVVAEICPGPLAEVVGDASKHIGTIEGGDYEVVTWTLRATDYDKENGELVANTITVSAEGIAEYSDATLTVEVDRDVLIYPAAVLVVENITVDSSPVVVGDTFTVTADLVNIGMGDAWDVSAILSVPESMARVIESPDHVGTLAGAHGGEPNRVTVEWTLRCKSACDTPITISAAGFDEHGWYTKQAHTGKLRLASVPGRAIDDRFIKSDTVTVKQVEPAHLVVDLGYPEDGAYYDAGESFVVTGTITNIGEETAEDVTVTLTVDDHASITGAVKELGDIAGGQSVELRWDVQCDELGFSMFKATVTEATGAISGQSVTGAFDTVTVKQGEVPLGHVVVDIVFPESGTEFTEGDVFPVTARIANIGTRTAEGVDVGIDVGPKAEVVSGPNGWPKDIGPNSHAMVTWHVECTEAGFSVMVVETSGNNTNVAMDSVVVKQVPPPAPYLTVAVTAPATVYEGSTYNVSAVVTNIGSADASDVDATITINGPAETAEALVKDVAAVLGAGDSVVVNWELTSNGQGGVAVSVSAAGANTNTAASSVAVQQTLDFNIWTDYLDSIDATLVDIVDGLAVIDTTLGEMVVELEAINGTLVDIVDGMAVIDTTLGEMVVELEAINGTLVDIVDGMAVIDTTLGQIKVAIEEILGPDPLVLVTSPNGGEVYYVVDGTETIAITWEAHDDVTAQADLLIKLEYSTDNGATWETIVSDLPNDGAYSWLAPQIDSDQCLVRVSATDGHGNVGFDTSNAAFTITTTVPWEPVTSFEIELRAGWNLISLPLIPEDSAIATVLAGILDDVESVHHYDAVAGEWLVYSPPIGDLTTMVDGKAYWIEMDAAATLVITGQQLPDPPAMPPTYQVAFGWNMVGFKSTVEKSANEYLAAMAGKYILTYGFDAAWFTLAPANNMVPGLGYWVYFTEGGEIVP